MLKGAWRVPLLATAMVLMLVASVRRAEAKDLRWQFEEGQRLQVRFTQSSHVRRVVKAKELKMSHVIMMEMLWVIDEVNADGSAEITQSFTRVVVKMDMPEAGETEYDSSSGELPKGIAKTLAEAVTPLIGSSIRVSMTPQGELTDVSLSAEITKALEQKARAGKLNNLFSADALKRILRQSLITLPNESVAKGDTWSTDFVIESPVGKMTQKNEYVYQGEVTEQERTYDKIEVSSAVELGQGAAPASGMKITSQTHAGQILFDEAAGRVAKVEVKQTLTSEKKYRDVLIELESVAALVTTFETAPPADPQSP